MRLDWRRLAARLPPACGFTGLSSVHRIVSGAHVGASTNSPLSGIVGDAAAKIHQTVRCIGLSSVHRTVRELAALAPTVGSAISAQSVGDTWPKPTITRPHQTVWCAKGPWLQRSASSNKERDHALSCPVVHRTVRCDHRQKATIAYKMELQRLLAALGL
jgi:hypothetical protein